MDLDLKQSLKDDELDAFLMDTSDLGCHAKELKSQSDREQIALYEQFLKARRQSKLIEHLTSLQKLESSLQIQKTIVERIVNFETYERDTCLGKGQDDNRLKAEEPKDGVFNDKSLISDLGAKKRYIPQQDK